MAKEEPDEMIMLAWWMRVVGALYLFMAFVAIVPRIPIRVEGPAGIMAQVAAGDPTARFVVDTWVMFGLYVGMIGVALLVASHASEQARALAWTVLGLELVGGIGIDIYKLARGYRRAAPLAWIVVHSAVIATGLLCLRQPQ